MTELRIAVAMGIAAAACGLGCTVGVAGSDADGAGYGDGDADADTDTEADADADAEWGPATGRVVGEASGETHPPLSGVEVQLLDANGEVIDESRTDGDGEYAFRGLPATAAFVVARPTDGWVGQLRAEGIREGLRFYDLTLQSEDGLDRVEASASVVRDPSRGVVVVGFNPADREAGGEGATLVPANHDVPFTLLDDGALTGNVLPPICAGAPASDGADCVAGDRGDFVFFPNVVPGFERIELIQPAGGACALRFDVRRWVVISGVSTIIEADCEPR